MRRREYVCGIMIIVVINAWLIWYDLDMRYGYDEVHGVNCNKIRHKSMQIKLNEMTKQRIRGNKIKLAHQDQQRSPRCSRASDVRVRAGAEGATRQAVPGTPSHARSSCPPPRAGVQCRGARNERDCRV